MPPPELTLSVELKRSNLLPGRHTPPTPQCFLREADRHGIDPYILLAVLQTENGKPGEMALNRNGTFDLGPMSVNTVWLPTLAKRYRISEPELRSRLASDGCANIIAAAWILKRNIVETGNVWEGVARFHSRNPSRQGPYLRRVHARLSEIIARFKAAVTTSRLSTPEKAL
jgi:hypothetical protein